MLESLRKRKPERSSQNWNELDDMALKSTFDFKSSDLSLSKREPVFSRIAPKDSLSRTTFWISMEEPGKIQVKCNLRQPEKPVDFYELKELLKKQTAVSQSSDDEDEGQYDDLSDSKSLSEPKKPIEVSQIQQKNPSPAKAGNKELTINKPGYGAKKIKVSTQRYRFLDWEQRTKDKYMKPTGQEKIERFREIKPRRPQSDRWMPSNSFKPAIDSPQQSEKPLLTFTDKNFAQLRRTQAEEVELIESQELKFNRKTYKMEKHAGRAAKIFQESDKKSGDALNILVRGIPQPFGEIKSSLGIVKEQRNPNVQRMFEVHREPLVNYTISPQNQIIDVDELSSTQRSHTPIALDQKYYPSDATQGMMYNSNLNPDSEIFHYTLNCPPFKADILGNLQVKYESQLAEIYKHNPVVSHQYFYRDTSVHIHDRSVMSMLAKFDYSDKLEKGRDVKLVLKQFNIESNEHSSLLSPNQRESFSRPNFKYILVKVGLDNKLVRDDLIPLNPQELHMMVAFFNVKFCILTKEDKLSTSDSLDRILEIANKHIANVLQRAYNFKKNEEFLKKKWKEFLKFCKLKMKELKLSKTNHLAKDFATRNDVTKLIYEEFHRPTVLLKMKQYKEDPVQYYKSEWGCSNETDLCPPEDSSDDLPEYSQKETQFMKQFFSIKA